MGPGNKWPRYAQGGTVSLNDQLFETAGDMAYEAGIERGQVTLAGRNVPIEHRVTNVYRREAEGWKIVHLITDLAPAMVELLKSLDARSRTRRRPGRAEP